MHSISCNLEERMFFLTISVVNAGFKLIYLIKLDMIVQLM